MKLSDKLSAIAESFGMMYDHYETMEQVITLAKRYEDAPSGEILEVMERSSIIDWDQDAPSHLYGQRVRIVLDKEGAQ